MKILLFMFLILFILSFLFAKVRVNGSTNISIFQRAGVCFVGSLILSLFIGLPILGILYLVK
jgi:hypothetical protein